MALNPPLLAGGLPAGIVGEYYLLQRTGIDATIEEPSVGKQKLSNATLYVTTVRICVVAPKASSTGLQAIDIPLQGISGEEFKQPILGANRLEGTVANVPGRGLAAPAKFSLKLTHGGANTFLRVFFALREKYLSADAAHRSSWLAPQHMQQWVSNTAQAFVDPSDPSRLYLVQPPVFQAPPPVVMQPQMQMQMQPQVAYVPTPGFAPPPSGGGMTVPMQQVPVAQPVAAGSPAAAGYAHAVPVALPAANSAGAPRVGSGV